MSNEIAAGSLNSLSIVDRHISQAAAISRSKLAQRVLAADAFRLETLRSSADLAVNLPAAAAASDLGLVSGVLGTDAPSIQSGDLKAAGATTRYARLSIPLPDDYEDGETVTLRFRAGMKTTIADTSATIDAEARLNQGDGTVGADLCATPAQSINALAAADFDFTITPATLGAGDMLDVRVAIAVNDAATATAVIGCLYGVSVLCDRR